MSKSNSMINPSIIELLKKVDNRYSLVVATSRRARQIIDGQEPLVDEKGSKPLTIAIDEVNEGILEVTEREDLVEGIKFVEEDMFKTTEKLEEVELPGNAEGVEEGLI